MWFLVTFVFQNTGVDSQKKSDPKVGPSASRKKHVNCSMGRFPRKRLNLFFGSDRVREGVAGPPRDGGSPLRDATT